MKYRIVVLVATVLASILGWAGEEGGERFEFGAQVTALDLRATIGEKPGGVGGRFICNLNDYLSLESEVNYFPQNPSGNFGETQALFGAKVGYRRRDIGIFAKVRPGFVHFGGDFYRVRNPGNLTHPAVDLGGVLEMFPREHVGFRVDVGDTIVGFGDRPIQIGAIKPFAGGIGHNFQVSLGILFRF